MNWNLQRIFTPFFFLSVMGLLAIFSSTMSKSPTLTLFAVSLGASDPEIGLIAAASTIPGIVASLPFGILSDIYGRRKVILLSAALFGLSPFLYLFVINPFQLAFVRFVHGFATAIFGPVSVALVADLFPTRRGEKMSIFSSVTLLGRLMAPLVGGILLTLTNKNFQMVYLVCGVSAILAFAAATKIRSEKKVSKGLGKQSISAAFREGFSEVISEHHILAVSVVEAGQFFAYGAVEAFIPKYGESALGLSDWQIGVLLGLEVALLMLTKPFMGRLSDRVGRRLPIILGLFLGASSLALMFLATSFLSLALVLMVFGVAMAMVTASTSPLIADLCKQKSYGSAMGVLDTIMDIGQTLGPITLGLLIPILYYYLSFALVGFVLLILAFLFIVTVR
jgi:DHA1 family multidrug resistance protein-like MFS transporter